MDTEDEHPFIAVTDQPGHPVAVPCLREHCQYHDMNDRLIGDYGCRQELANLKRDYLRLLSVENRQRRIRRSLSVITSQVMSSPRTLRREKVLALLAKIGL